MQNQVQNSITISDLGSTISEMDKLSQHYFRQLMAHVDSLRQLGVDTDTLYDMESLCCEGMNSIWAAAADAGCHQSS
jgi:hypothetical protein